jgi:hypothetical protein
MNQTQLLENMSPDLTREDTANHKRGRFLDVKGWDVFFFYLNEMTRSSPALFEKKKRKMSSST